MKIGLTYDLRSEYLAAGYSEEDTAEFDRDDTVDAIEGALRSLGHQTARIGRASQLIQRLADGERWDLVFNICEGLSGPSRESQVPAILDVYGIPATFADAAVMALCLNKAWAKLAVAAAGVATARQWVVRRPQDVQAIHADFPLIAKPIAEGTGKGITGASVIRDNASLTRQCAMLLDRFQQPVLVETFLPGREFTVGLVGTGDAARVLGTLEIVLLQTAEADVYSYLNKEDCETRVEYRLVSPAEDELVARAEAAALTAWRALDCRDAGRIDLRTDSNGQPKFIEANPLAGLHPEHSDLPMLATALGMPYTDLIRVIVDSAAARLPTKQTQRCVA